MVVLRLAGRALWGLVAISLSTCALARATDAGASGSAPAILRGLAPAWLEAFAGRGGSVRIEPPFGPPQGDLDPKLAAFLDGRGDFALLTREIAEIDLARFRAHHGGLDPIVVPVAGGAWERFGYVDAVAIIVHRSNPLRALTYQQLDSIFSSSRLHGGLTAATWGDLGLRGRWRDLPVRVVGGEGWPREESARALTIRRHVLSVGTAVGRWREFPGSGYDDGVVARVTADPAAIGFTGMGHRTPAVRAVAIAGPGMPPIVLDARSARSGRYPLLRTVDLLLPPQPRSESLAFARFLTSREGQAVVARQGEFLPLPPLPLAQARKLLAGLR